MAAKAWSAGQTQVRPGAAFVPSVTFVRASAETNELRPWDAMVLVWLTGRVRNLWYMES